MAATDAFVIVVGGSGSLVLESLVHTANLSVFRDLKLHVLAIDMDGLDPNLQQAQDAVKRYNELAPYLPPKDGVDIQIDLHVMTWKPGGRHGHVDTLGKKFDESANNRDLIRVLYSESQAKQDVSHGFDGDAKLSAAFISHWLSEAENTHELQLFLRALEESKSNRLFVAGSCFGGMGAGMIAALSRYLQKNYPQFLTNEFSLGLLAIVPHMAFVTSGQPVSSAGWYQATAEALHRFVNPTDTSSEYSIYQHIFLLGADEPISTSVRQRDDHLSANPATVTSWYGCIAIRQFFSKAFAQNHSETQLHMAAHAYGSWGWDQFWPQRYPDLEKQNIIFLQAIIFYRAYIKPAFANYHRNPGNEDLDYWLSGLQEEQRVKFFGAMGALEQYMLRYVDWLWQMATHLPKPAVLNRVEQGHGADSERNKGRVYGSPAVQTAEGNFSERSDAMAKTETLAERGRQDQRLARKTSGRQRKRVDANTIELMRRAELLDVLSVVDCDLAEEAAESLTRSKFCNSTILCMLEQSGGRSKQPVTTVEKVQNQTQSELGVQFAGVSTVDGVGSMLVKYVGNVGAGTDGGRYINSEEVRSALISVFRTIAKDPRYKDALEAFRFLWTTLIKKIVSATNQSVGLTPAPHAPAPTTGIHRPSVMFTVPGGEPLLEMLPLTIGEFNPVGQGMRYMQAAVHRMDRYVLECPDRPDSLTLCNLFHARIAGECGECEMHKARNVWMCTLSIALLSAVLAEHYGQFTWQKLWISPDYLLPVNVGSAGKADANDLWVLFVQGHNAELPIAYINGLTHVALAAQLSGEALRSIGIAEDQAWPDFSQWLQRLSYQQKQLLRRRLAMKSMFGDHIYRPMIDQMIEAIDGANEPVDIEMREAWEESLLIGLMVRNTADCDISVVQLGADPSFEELPIWLSDPEHRSDCVEALILLGERPVGWLDKEQLLCTMANAAWFERDHKRCNDQMRKLIEIVNSARKPDTDLHTLVRHQLSVLKNSFHDAPVLKRLMKSFGADMTAKKISVKWVITKAHPDELDLSKGPFRALRRMTYQTGEPEQLFSTYLLYTGGDDLVKGMLEQRTLSGIPYHIIRPTGIFGASLLTSETEYTLTCIPKHQDDDTLLFHTEIVACDRDIRYSAAKDYTGNHIISLDERQTIPCVALWANVADRAMPGWRIYYVFVCIHGNESGDFAVQAYDTQDGPIGPHKYIHSKHTRGKEKYWWSIFECGSRPKYLLLSRHGQSAGMLPLQGMSLPEAVGSNHPSKSAILAIDFGASSSIAAYRLNEDNYNEIFSMNHNGLLWLLNQKAGLPAANRFFIGNQLFTCLAPKEKFFAVQTIFRTNERITGDAAMRDAEYLDGNIIDLTSETDEGDAAIQYGFKSIRVASAVADDPKENDEDMNLRITRVFIKQFLHFCLLSLRLNNARKLDVYFATPLVLTYGAINPLGNAFINITKEVASRAGYNVEQDVNIHVLSESCAVGAFFYQKAQSSIEKSPGIFTLDIGGGTSDYSFWMKQTRDVNPNACCSNLLGGRELLSRTLCKSIERNHLMDDFIQSLEQQVMSRDPAAQKHKAGDIKKLIKKLKNLRSTNARRAILIDQWLDLLFLSHHQFMEKVLQSGSCGVLQSIISLGLLLLFWLANIVVYDVEKWDNVTAVGHYPKLFLAGHGANFYHMLPPWRHTVIANVFQKMGRPMLIVSDRGAAEQKTEVAMGLIHYSQLGKIVEGEDPQSRTSECGAGESQATTCCIHNHRDSILLNKQTTAESINDLLEKYADELQAHQNEEALGSAFHCLTSDTNKMSALKDMVEENARTLDGLNRSILNMRDQIMDGLGFSW